MDEISINPSQAGSGKIFREWLSEKLSSFLPLISHATFAKSCGLSEAALLRFLDGTCLPTQEALNRMLASLKSGGIVSDSEQFQVQEMVIAQRANQPNKPKPKGGKRKGAGRPVAEVTQIRLFPSVPGETIKAIALALATWNLPNDRATIRRQLQQACYDGGINQYLEKLGLPSLKIQV